jgi:two-component system phosphate regulon sensor histidine kinase PhoR
MAHDAPILHTARLTAEVMTERADASSGRAHGVPQRRIPALIVGLVAAGCALVLCALLLAHAGIVEAALTLCGLALLLTAVSGPWHGHAKPKAADPTGTVGQTASLLRRPLSPRRVDLDTVVSALPDPAIALDGDNRVICFNTAASLVAPALRLDELASVSLRAPEIVDAVRTVAATGEPIEVDYTPRGSADRHYNVHVLPVARDRVTEPVDQATTESEASFILIVFHDLTPLVRVEEMRADFVANASHELRTPLAALAGFIDTLQGPAREDEAARARFLPIMRAQATRMARLIDDLLSLSRIELNAHQRPTDPVALDGVLRQVVDGLQMLSTERDVTIDIKTLTEMTTVLGDRDELIRVFENLIENALKYGGAGKRVEITVERRLAANSTPELMVAVRDYGPGIAPEHLPRLTERFYRVDVRDSRAQGGTGLGLALVKHILNRHRGRLTIASKPEEGATFTVHLPQPSQYLVGA